jgi:hypothetical protein
LVPGWTTAASRPLSERGSTIQRVSFDAAGGWRLVVKPMVGTYSQGVEVNLIDAS